MVRTNCFNSILEYKLEILTTEDLERQAELMQEESVSEGSSVDEQKKGKDQLSDGVGTIIEEQHSRVPSDEDRD
jgi:hypothetical protein